MAHHKATKKAIKTSAKRNVRNRSYKSKVKTAIKQFDESTSTEDKAKNLKNAQQILDRAAQKKVITKSYASRKVSSLAQKSK